MPHYFVFLENERPDVAAKIESVDQQSYQLSSRVFFLTSSLAAGQLANKLELPKKEHEEEPGTGLVIEVGSDYAGRAPKPFWDWIKKVAGE